MIVKLFMSCFSSAELIYCSQWWLSLISDQCHYEQNQTEKKSEVSDLGVFKTSFTRQTKCVLWLPQMEN